MLDNLKQYMLFGNTFFGVELIQGKDKGDFIFCSVKKHRKEITLVDKQVLASIQDIKKIATKTIGIQLIINNDQTLTKQVELSNSNPDQLVNSAFPNINLEAFYYNILTQKNKSFITICRKQYIDELIKDFINNGIIVIGFSLGNLSISNILPFLKEQKIFTNNAEVENINDQINSITHKSISEKTEYDINGLKVSNQFIISVFAALNPLITDTNLIKANSKNEFLKKEYSQKRFFSQLLKLGLASLFFVLLINFLFYNHYYNEVQELSQINQINTFEKERLNVLKSDVDKKEKFIDDILKSGASKSSFYANDIISNMPSTILLEELNYQPLTKGIKNDKPIEYVFNTILITGESNESQDISNWVSVMEQLDWVENIVITEFGETKNGLTSFSLKLKII